jgi:hypothetical protein
MENRNTSPRSPLAAPNSPLPAPTSQGTSGRSWSRPRRRKRAGISPFAGIVPLFWTLVALLGMYTLYTAWDRPRVFTFCAVALGVAALWPAWLWCTGRVTGLPIYPLYAATFLPAFVFPFLDAAERIREYTNEELLRAAFTTAVFLFIGTLVWIYWSTRRHKVPKACRALEGANGTDALLIAILVATAFTMLDHAGWLGWLPLGVLTIIRPVLRGPVSFAVFVLGMRWGRRLLTPWQRIGLLCLFVVYCGSETSSLFLVGSILACLMLGLGFILGRGRMPWGGIVVAVCVTSLLHVGKAEMRSNYWKEGEQGNQLAPQQYPAFYAEWALSTVKTLALQKKGLENESASFLSRANTVYLLLLAQRTSPEEVPFLEGETYRIIPSALVPRLISPGKESPHYSTSLLNVLYGKQTWESAESTSIGWGMFNEAYANFGYTGCAVAAVIIGSFFGLVSWWCKGMPPGSIHYLIGIYTLGFALQTEMTAAIFITAYLQGLVGLLVLAWIFAKKRNTLEPEFSPAELQSEPEIHTAAWRKERVLRRKGLSARREAIRNGRGGKSVERGA